MALEDFVRDVDGQLTALFKVSEAYELAPFTVKELRNSLVFEMIKTAYDRLEPRNSLRRHRGTDEDYARMHDSRNKAYVQHYRNLQFGEMKRRGFYEPALLSQDVSSMEGKLAGHKLTEIQYYEMNSLAAHPLLKAIVSKRICDVKKISNKTFREYMDDYSQWVNSLEKMLEGDDDSVLFATIELFTLEWKYCTELYYRYAVEAEKHDCQEPDKLKMVAVCADVTIPQPLNPNYSYLTHSRFIPYRNALVPFMFDENAWREINEKLFEYLVAKEFILVTDYYGKTIVDEFCERTTKAEWVTFIRENFNLKGSFTRKEWNNKRIRYVRKLFEMMVKNQPTPESK